MTPVISCAPQPTATPKDQSSLKKCNFRVLGPKRLRVETLLLKQSPTNETDVKESLPIIFLQFFL